MGGWICLIAFIFDMSHRSYSATPAKYERGYLRDKQHFDSHIKRRLESVQYPHPAGGRCMCPRPRSRGFTGQQSAGIPN